MKKSFWVSVLIILVFAIIETTFFSNLAFLPAVPDFILLSTLYFSILNGKTFGELTGFSSGLILDFLSGCPFGFNSIFRTIICYIAGFFTGTINFNGIFMPCLIGFCGTLCKTLLIWLVSLFFTCVSSYNIFSFSYFFELICNTVLAPFVFKLINCFEKYLKYSSIEEGF